MDALRVALLLMVALATTGCDLVVGIFEAGIWIGAIFVALIVGAVAYLARRLRRRPPV